MILTLPLDAIIIVLFIITCAGIGSRIQVFLFRHCVWTNSPGHFLLSTGLGFFATSYLTFVLGYLGLIYRLTFLVVLLAFLWWTRRESASFIREFRGFSPGSLSREEKVLLAVLCISVFFNLLYNYCPPTAEDEISTHLGIPAKWILRHAIYSIPGASAQYFPSGVHMNYTFLAAIGSVQTARLFHYVSGLFCLLAVYLLARKFIDRSSSLLACTIFYTIPAVTSLSGVGNTDFGTLLYAILAIYAFLNWLSEKNKPWFLITAVFTGAHAACKYTGFPLLIILPALIFYEKRQHLMSAFKQATIFFAIAFSCVLPYLVRNFIITSNPLYPKKFLHFKYDELLYYSYLLPEPFFAILRRMLELSSGDVIWGIGPLFVAFLPFIFIFRISNHEKRNISMLFFVIAGLNYLLLFIARISYQLSRHSIISFALLSIPVAHAIIQIYQQMNIRIYMSFLIFLAFLNGLSLSLYFGGKRIPMFLGLETPQNYFNREYDIWEGSFFVRYINANIPQGAGILFLNNLSAPQLNYPKHRIFGMDAFGENFYRLSPEDAAPEFEKYGINYILVCWDNFVIDGNGNIYWKSGNKKLPIGWFKTSFVKPIIMHNLVSFYETVR